MVVRGLNLVETLDKERVEAVVDLVAGPQWPELLELLKLGGRYATAGAIAGPIVPLDVRTLYLTDLNFFSAARFWTVRCFQTWSTISSAVRCIPW